MNVAVARRHRKVLSQQRPSFGVGTDAFSVMLMALFQKIRQSRFERSPVLPKNLGSVQVVRITQWAS